jgi:hypothetical protein
MSKFLYLNSSLSRAGANDGNSPYKGYGRYGRYTGAADKAGIMEGEGKIMAE